MFARSLLVQAAVAAVPVMSAALSSGPMTCPADSPLSCHGTSDNTCCFNSPGGQILLTQFWDTDPSTGPADSWTIHGLWPDNCDGSYEQYCAPSREYFNITQVLQATTPCTLGFMKNYWKDYQGNDEDFWEHEFNKHGTCMSTLDPACYTNYKPGQEVVDYFKRAVGVFKRLPSYKWLKEAGIVPSSDKTYTLADVQAALKSHHGHDVIVNCDKQGRLNELWYHYNVQGSIQSGKFVAADPVGSPSTCPKTGIKYLPKYATATPKPTTTAATASSGPAPTTAPGQLSGKGRLYVKSGSKDSGFVIGVGKWYNNGGTPATFTATPNADGTTFGINSSKGKCAVQSDSSLTCDTSVTDATPFGYDGSFLTYKSSNTFYAASAPSGVEQGTIYTDSKAVSLQISWTQS